MGITRWAFYNKLKEIYPNVSLTYGYMTKNSRIENGLNKTHAIDARCISGNPTAIPTKNRYHQKATRKRNRQIHKATISKGGVRKLNQAPKYVFGYQMFDKVICNGVVCFIFGRRTSGYFDARVLDGTRVSAGISHKKLTLLEKRKTILTERGGAPPMTEVTGFRA
jgi:hypothetical protein